MTSVTKPGTFQSHFMGHLNKKQEEPSITQHTVTLHVPIIMETDTRGNALV